MPQVMYPIPQLWERKETLLRISLLWQAQKKEPSSPLNIPSPMTKSMALIQSIRHGCIQR